MYIHFAGQFVALTNLGICYGIQRNVIQVNFYCVQMATENSILIIIFYKTCQSAKSHQDALRLAIKMQSVRGQAISVGNLGMLALLKADRATATTCFEQVKVIVFYFKNSEYNILCCMQHLSLVQALQDKEAEVNAWKMVKMISTLQHIVRRFIKASFEM